MTKENTSAPAAENKMGTMPIGRLLFNMSLPMMVSMLVQALYNIVDSYFVAKISEDAMTSLSLVFPVQNFINAVAIGFGVGINAVIAFYLGAGDKNKADSAATQGFLLSIIHGVVLTATCIFVMKPFLLAFTKDENVISLGVQYCNIVFLFTVINSLNLHNYLTGSGNDFASSKTCHALNHKNHILLKTMDTILYINRHKKSNILSRYFFYSTDHRFCYH